MYPSKVERHKKAMHREGDTKRRNTKKLKMFCQICNKGFPHHSKLGSNKNINENSYYLLLGQTFCCCEFSVGMRDEKFDLV